MIVGACFIVYLRVLFTMEKMMKNRIEIVEDNDPWVMIRTPGGTEGWILKRYLSNEPPLAERVDTLKKQKAELETQQKEVKSKYDELLTAYTKLEQEHNSYLSEDEDFKQKYEMLKKDTANVIAIKKELMDASRQVEEAKQQLTAIEQENKNLKNNLAVKWFLAGGLVLFTGWIIGLMCCRTRKRKSTLY